MMTGENLTSTYIQKLMLQNARLFGNYLPFDQHASMQLSNTFLRTGGILPYDMFGVQGTSHMGMEKIPELTIGTKALGINKSSTRETHINSSSLPETGNVSSLHDSTNKMKFTYEHREVSRDDANRHSSYVADKSQSSTYSQVDGAEPHCSSPLEISKKSTTTQKTEIGVATSKRMLYNAIKHKILSRSNDNNIYSTDKSNHSDFSDQAQTYIQFCDQSVSTTKNHKVKCTVEDCTATFSDVTSRDYHQQTHTAVYVCPESTCQKHFSCVLRLNRHYIIHKHDSGCTPQISDQVSSSGDILEDEENDSGHSATSSSGSSPLTVSNASTRDWSFNSGSDEAIDLSTGMDDVDGRTEAIAVDKMALNLSAEYQIKEVAGGEHVKRKLMEDETNKCESPIAARVQVEINNNKIVETTNHYLSSQQSQDHPAEIGLVPHDINLSKKRTNEILSDTTGTSYVKRRRLGRGSLPVAWMKSGTDKSIVVFEYTNGIQDEREIIKGRLPGLPRENEREFICSQCEFRSCKKVDALEHISLFQKHCISLVCSSCNIPSPCASTLHAHIRQFHRPSEKQRSPCPQDACLRMFASEEAAANHILTAGHGEHRYACPFQGCTKVFRTQGQLNHHHPIHTDIFQCKARGCQKRFRDAYNLRMHSMIHTGERPKSCPHCPFSCIQKNSLDWHIRKHHSSVSSKV